MEGYANAGTLNGSPGNSAPVGGRRRSRRSRKGVKAHLRLVKKTTVRKLLAKKGFRMRGGASAEPGAKDAVSTVTGEVLEKTEVAPAGGRRRKTAGRRKSRRSRKVFGLF
jgi:hypothetical protein